jgi:hypothetical protein
MTTDKALRAGEWVEVRCREEILRTLDRNGQLEGLPFMPEMFEACGQRFRVFKRAHKTCDPPSGMLGRRMPRAVHLQEFRCNGAAHGGCQAKCLIFWKEAWLKRVDGETAERARTPAPSADNRLQPVCTERDVVAGTRRGDAQDTLGDPAYICQSTQISQATLPLSRLDLRQYVEDYASGNVRLSQFLGSFLFFVSEQLASAGLGLGTAVRWTYDTIQKARGGTPYPVRIGKIPVGVPTPAAKLNLKKGELVQVRSYQEILETINEDSHNRGMSFDPEMVPYCGGTYRVLDRVSQIINEKTGKMMRLKKDCIMLDEVLCRACYAKHRKFCPRRIYPYWREVWLKRVGSDSEAEAPPDRPLAPAEGLTVAADAARTDGRAASGAEVSGAGSR